MSTQVTNYQCPACTGPLHFTGASGKLECDYCGSTYDVAEIEALFAQKEQAAVKAGKEAEQKTKQAKKDAEESGWQDCSGNDTWSADGMKSYICPSCGAELVCDETTAATSCPYCGNPTIVPGQFSGTKKPDFIIPFKLDKNAATEALKKHCKGKRFLPKAFTDENHIQEIQGIYVPFWLFNGQGQVDASFEATRSSTYETSDERITDTEHFHIERSGNVAFERVPVDASTKMPDANMDAIEPFDYSELTAFSTAYLPGFLADKYDVSIEESAGRADARCEESCIQAMEQTVVGYDTVTRQSANVQLTRGKVQYAMLPVWMLHTKWKNKDYLFSMNGQTGRFIGDLPVSWKKFWLWLAGICLGCTALLSVLCILLMR